MPLDAYGVLIATPVELRRESSADTPHFQIHVVDDAGVDYRIAVNVEVPAVALGADVPRSTTTSTIR